MSRIFTNEKEPVSTFSADVDTTSYSFVHRQLKNGLLPIKDAVRVEEMINYFDYTYQTPPTKEVPFQPTIAVSDSPWNQSCKLITIGIKGHEMRKGQVKPQNNVVLLLDTSSSMQHRWSLVKQSMQRFLTALNAQDRVAIATYDHRVNVPLQSTPVYQRKQFSKRSTKLFSTVAPTVPKVSKRPTKWPKRNTTRMGTIELCWQPMVISTWG